MQMGLCRSGVGLAPCSHGRLLVPSAGEQGGAVSCRLRAEPPGGAATGPAEPPLGSRPLTHACPTARNARLPFQRGEQARVRGGGVASAELLLRCGELRPRLASPPGSRWALSAHTSQRFILSLRFSSRRDSQPRGHWPPAGASPPQSTPGRRVEGRRTVRGACAFSRVPGLRGPHGGRFPDLPPDALAASPGLWLPGRP